ncbi:MAG: hypothetical protein QNJ57_04490 [Flavobacteriaceae bacterium]|nr:hypothetical protein [Flavobacteriaceae bacterium]
MARRNIIIAAGILLLTTQFALGQSPEKTKELAAYQDKVLFEAFNLTEQQKESVSAINLKFTEKQSELMGQEGSKFSKFGKMKQLKKEKNEALKAILSQEQFEACEKDIAPRLRKEMRKKMSI